MSDSFNEEPEVLGFERRANSPETEAFSEAIIAVMTQNLEPDVLNMMATLGCIMGQAAGMSGIGVLSVTGQLLDTFRVNFVEGMKLQIAHELAQALTLAPDYDSPPPSANEVN